MDLSFNQKAISYNHHPSAITTTNNNKNKKLLHQ